MADYKKFEAGLQPTQPIKDDTGKTTIYFTGSINTGHGKLDIVAAFYDEPRVSGESTAVGDVSINDGSNQTIWLNTYKDKNGNPFTVRKANLKNIFPGIEKSGLAFKEFQPMSYKISTDPELRKKKTYTAEWSYDAEQVASAKSDYIHGDPDLDQRFGEDKAAEMPY